MKHLLITLITLASLSAFAQSTTPRTGVGVFHDNTFRAMTLKYIPITSTVTNDTVALSLNGYKTLVSIPALSDTVTLTFPSVASCYLGDEFTVTAIGAGTILFSGSKVAVSSAGVKLSPSARANITFIFDGTVWAEEHRVVQ